MSACDLRLQEAGHFPAVNSDAEGAVGAGLVPARLPELQTGRDKPCPYSLFYSTPRSGAHLR